MADFVGFGILSGVTYSPANMISDKVKHLYYFHWTHYPIYLLLAYLSHRYTSYRDWRQAHVANLACYVLCLWTIFFFHLIKKNFLVLVC